MRKPVSSVDNFQFVQNLSFWSIKSLNSRKYPYSDKIYYRAPFRTFEPYDVDAHSLRKKRATTLMTTMCCRKRPPFGRRKIHSHQSPSTREVLWFKNPNISPNGKKRRPTRREERTRTKERRKGLPTPSVRVQTGRRREWKVIPEWRTESRTDLCRPRLSEGKESGTKTSPVYGHGVSVVWVELPSQWLRQDDHLDDNSFDT